MKSFTLENETNQITVYPTKREAAAVPNAQCFSSIEELARIAASWPVTRLIEIWNSIPGNQPVRKFTDRRTAATRIWKAIQSLGESVANEAAAEPQKDGATPSEIVTPFDEPAAHHKAKSAREKVQPQATPEVTEGNAGAQTPDVAPAKGAAKGKATRKQKAPTSEKTVKTPRAESKTSRVIQMLRRAGGTTLEEIMNEMHWQKHTTRALLSAGGSLTRKHGLVVTSEKAGEQRVYSIKG